jgi:hypothetical protein
MLQGEKLGWLLNLIWPLAPSATWWTRADPHRATWRRKQRSGLRPPPRPNKTQTLITIGRRTGRDRGALGHRSGRDQGG